jgi:hypothetical protein
MAKRTTVTSTKIEEVQDLESEATPTPALDLAGGSRSVTGLALLAGVIIGQLAMKHYFGAGLFG